MNFAIWFVLVLVAIVIATFASVFAYSRLMLLNWRAPGIASAIGFAIVLPVLLSPVYYDFPLSGNMVLATYKEDYGIKTHPFGMFTWMWNNKDFVLLMGPVGAVQSEVTPITENPKARTVCYQVVPTIALPLRFYERDESRRISPSADYVFDPGGKTREEVHRLTRYHLYEFDNRFSRELGELYNPLDEAQQGRFRKLIVPWLNESLRENGIEIVDASFWLGE